MRVAPALRLAAIVLLAVACVPRPAALGGPSDAVGSGSAVPDETAAVEPTDAGPTPSPSFVRPTPLPAPTFLVYTVKSGDTLTSIARAFQTTPRSIAFWSRGEHPSLDPESTGYSPDHLEIGWILLLVPNAVFDESELPDTTPAASAAPSPTAPLPSAS
jgi:hypothetical protein